MKTNDLKKGAAVILNNGWKAVIEDNMKGNRRMATVHGFCTEMGSIYAHDISSVINSETGMSESIELTKSQLKLKKVCDKWAF